MAIITDAVRMAYLAASAESDLTFLWSESEMTLDLQYQLAFAGYRTLRKFVGLEDDKPKVRAALIADFNLDPAAAPGNRLHLAAAVSSWEVATQLLARETVIRAEAKASRIPRPLTNQEQVSMRRIVEQIYGPIPLSETPSAEYLSAKIEEVESNCPTAARLDEVTSLEHVESQSLTATVTPSGNLMVLHKRSKTVMPTGPESFRMRMRVEAHLWIFLGTKFSNRLWLLNLTPQDFSRYVDHFLGSKCNDMKIPSGASGEDTCTALLPPWSVVLNYEFACRRTAFTWVREKGMTLKAALEQVVTEAELKEIHFTSPIALMGHGQKRQSTESQGGSTPRPTKSQRRAAAAARNAGVTPAAPSKGGGGGKGKGKGGGGSKGAGKGKGKGNMVGNTPDGRQICFAFNSAVGCPGDCGRVHVCRRRGCNQEHSVLVCTMT
jgi:hypothetical protein